MRTRFQSGQVMVLVAVSLMALIGSAALVLLAGSAEWQKNQLQQLADQAALDSAMKIGIGCDAGKASTVITEADNFLATQRARTGVLGIAGGSCTGPYTGTDSDSWACHCSSDEGRSCSVLGSRNTVFAFQDYHALSAGCVTC